MVCDFLIHSKKKENCVQQNNRCVFFVQFQQGNDDGDIAVDAVLVDDNPPVPDDINVDDVVLADGLTQQDDGKYGFGVAKLAAQSYVLV